MESQDYYGLGFVLFFWLFGVVSVLLPIPRNGIIGYRTPKSMKSDKHWWMAQKLSGIFSILFASCSVVGRVFLHQLGVLTDAYLTYMWIDFAVIVVLIITLTEIFLEKVLKKMEGLVS